MGVSTPPPGTIVDTNIICGIIDLPRSSGLRLGCFPVDFELRYEFRYSAHPLYFQ
jgi:hypothetical protein